MLILLIECLLKYSDIHKTSQETENFAVNLKVMLPTAKVVRKLLQKLYEKFHNDCKSAAGPSTGAQSDGKEYQT